MFSAKYKDHERIEYELKTLYDVADVNVSYRYWFTKLLQFCLGIFQWNNLPDTAEFTGRDIELQLLLYGHAWLFMKRGKYYTVHTSTYNYDVNYQPRNGVYANPVIGDDDFSINDSLGAMIYNSPIMDTIEGVKLDGSLFTFICHYARLLADIDSTINIYTVNCRITDYPIAKNDQMKKSLTNFFNKRALGQKAIIWQNDEILDAFGSVPKNKVTSDTLKDLIECEDRILEKFYRDLGIKFRQPKQAQLNTEEVESDEQILLISCDDMLKYRQDGIALFNDKMGTNISVKINPLYDRKSFKGETNNERNNADDNAIY